MSMPQPSTVEYWAATTPEPTAFVEGGRRPISAEHIVAKATNLRERAEKWCGISALPLELVEHCEATFASCVQ